MKVPYYSSPYLCDHDLHVDEGTSWYALPPTTHTETLSCLIPSDTESFLHCWSWKPSFWETKKKNPTFQEKMRRLNLTHRFQSFYFRTWGHCFFTFSLSSYRSMYLSSYFACTFMLILLPRYKPWRKKEATGQVNCEKFIFLK